VIRSLNGQRTVACGNFTVKLSGDPLTLRVQTKQGRPIQELRVDAATGNLGLQLGNGPILG
jgi:hypothetical protein